MTTALPSLRVIRDFYAFEQHVRTCRGHRGLDMVPQWYDIPVFYFTNPDSVIGDGDKVTAPQGCQELDFELEIAAIIGTECRDVPADDSAMEYITGFTIYNDFSARDLQRAEMKVGLGPSKGKDFANAFGPTMATVEELSDCIRDGKLTLEMKATRNGDLLCQNNSATMYWSWPQLIAHASRDCTLYPGDVLGSGTVGGGCILELTPESVGGWLMPGDTIELSIERIGTLTNQIVAR